MSYIAKINGETFFKTDSDDMSLALSSANLTLKAGAAGSFEFKVETTNRKYGQFRKNIDYVDVYRNAETVPIFSGRVSQTGRDFYLNDTVTVDGILSYFSDTIFRPILHEGTLGGYLDLLINNHNNQVEASKRIYLGLIEINRSQACYRDLQNYETTISRLQDLVDSFGGYLVGRKAANGTLYMDWLEDVNDGTTQRIDFGENLIDLNITENTEAVYTVLIPLGADDEETDKPITIESVNYGRDYLTAPQADINRYGYVYGVIKWEDVTVPSNLKNKAQAWMNENLKPRVTIDVTAADLADCGYDIENFRVGQKILVNSPPHGIIDEWFGCTDQNLDLLDPSNNTLSLGEEKIGYVGSRSSAMVDKILEKIAGKFPTSSMVQDAIENATTLITGNQGGYVVLYDSNGDDKPDEILVMDSLDKDTARKIWRWNKSGLGYSKNGYNGPFGLAMTIDGSIVADYITSGTMHGDRISSGTITVTQLGDGSVTTAKLDAEAVTAEKILSGAVTAVKIADGAVVANKIAANAVTAYNIAAATITANEIAGNTITAAEIASGAITADEIAANAVTASKIAAGAITADDITTGTMNADRIRGGQLTLGGPESYYGSLVFLDGHNKEQMSMDANYGILFSDGHNWSNYIQIVGDIMYLEKGGMQTEITGNSINFGHSDSIIHGDSYLECDGSGTTTKNLHVNGNLVVVGTKNRIINTDDYETRALYSYETASPMFGDVGEGMISDDGACYIMIDPIFAETIQNSQYQVFLQKYGEGDCFIQKRTPSFFIVSGTPGLQFGWELKAKQYDFTQYRLEPNRKPFFKETFIELPDYNNAINYAKELTLHIEEIAKERRIV